MSTVKTFRIIVLTYNRPHSLLRLLKSIENSDYTFHHNNPHWRLILEIRIDGGGGDLVTLNLDMRLEYFYWKFHVGRGNQ